MINAISEYADGPYGVIMTSVFFVQAIGSIALARLVWGIQPRKRKNLLGGLLFVFAAIGDVIAGLFQADPITAKTMTSHGSIHMAGGLIRFVSLAIGLPLLSSVLKKIAHWQKHGSLLKTIGTMFVVVFLGTVVVLAPLGLFGLGQRTFIFMALAWMFIVALPMISHPKTLP